MIARDRSRRTLSGSAGRHSAREAAVLVLGLAMLLALIGGCGGAGTTPPTPRAAEPAPPSGLPPGAIQTSPGDAFNVTIYSLGGQINVDKLEVEFNRRRGIHAFYGFYRDQYEEMTTIPFSALKRIQFEGPMPVGLYDQATIGREALNLSRDYAFQVQLTYRDERREEFFALIPKLRGEKDFVLWELTMNSSVAQIDYIDFDR